MPSCGARAALKPDCFRSRHDLLPLAQTQRLAEPPSRLVDATGSLTAAPCIGDRNRTGPKPRGTLGEPHGGRHLVVLKLKLTKPLKRALKKRAKQTGTSRAEVVLEALRHHLEDPPVSATEVRQQAYQEWLQHFEAHPDEIESGRDAHEMAALKAVTATGSTKLYTGFPQAGIGH